MKALVTLALVLAATDSAAQSFPVDALWDPLFCGQAVMSDPFQDEAGATAERDIVGNRDAPAAMYAADATFLYLRMRLDQDPIPTPPTVASSLTLPAT